MGANLSGEYGGVVVHDTIDTVSLSPIPVPSFNVIRRKIFSLFVAILFGTVLVGQTHNANLANALTMLIVGAVVLGGFWFLSQLPYTEYATVLLNISERTYTLERFSLFKKHWIAVQGPASEIREIQIKHYITEEPVFWSGNDPIFSFWSLTLLWKSRNEVVPALGHPGYYNLGYFRYEQRAREFAEELASRLGIPVVDKPHPCQEIARRVSSQVQQARETLRNALSWLR